MPAVAHVCPVCGGRHLVPPILDQLAYGRQLTCSPVCKTRYRKLILARMENRARVNGAQ
jgi:hypothetical protein